MGALAAISTILGLLTSASITIEQLQKVGAMIAANQAANPPIAGLTAAQWVELVSEDDAAKTQLQKDIEAARAAGH